MRIYAGIDEAGYGPLLGPLTVACTAWNTEESLGLWPDLWSALSSAVCRRPNDSKGRVAVDDSKTLKGAKAAKSHPLRNLERGVLSMLDAMQRESRPGEIDFFPLNEGDFLCRLGCDPAAALPWHREQNATQLPVATPKDDLQITANRVHLAFAPSGARLALMRCVIVEPEELNRLSKIAGSKAAVNELALLRLLCELREKFADADLCVACDRQGGRTRYLKPLQRAFPDAVVRIHDESDRGSRYELFEGSRRMSVSFEVDSEERHLPVALASMTAKYVRELSMARLNAYFTQRMPGLAPTAGYVEDGRRFLAKIRPHLAQWGVETDDLVRKM
ncbi:MAG: hypothetical protein K8R92_10930 [Planctomycetes bacterium]|nr:hypothetical protein [Planctomycetota bacterium]